ncbi:MAG: RNA polymerase sigma factor [bacterium]|nr:RNA polymerase sigma factor [bacterium]
MTNKSEIFEMYAESVYKYVLKLTKDTHRAEELTQETFYKAIVHINQFQEKCSMYTWLCEIAKNLYLNEEKHRKRKSVKEVNECNSSEDFVLGLLNKEQAFHLHRIIHNMDDPYKEVFTLRVFGELSHKEIAAIFDKTEAWAKVTYYRAKKMIIEKLEDVE